MSNKVNYSRLTGLYLENFQAIKLPTFIKLDGLVFLYGPNSAGKSSVIDALNIFKYLLKIKESKHYPKYYLPKMSDFRKSSIGLELKVGDLDSTYNKKIQVWENENDSSFNQDDSYKIFFKNVYQKNIQIEFSDDFYTIKVAIDSDPLFEMSGLRVNDYSFAHKKITDNEIELDENSFWGRLKIYKNNPYSRSLFSNAFSLLENTSLGYQDYYHYGLFVDEQEDTLIINGISYDGNEQDHPYPVGVGMSVEYLLFGDFARNISDDFSKQDADEKLIYNMFSKKSPNYRSFQNERTSLYWQLVEIAKEARLLVQGLYFHMESALEISHVKGDRALLNSKKPMYITSYSFLSDYLNEDIDSTISEYAEGVSSKFNAIYQSYNDIKKTDFINYSLQNYLKSLKSYKVIPEVYDLKPRKIIEEYPSENMLVFLHLLDQNKVKLGFEDVGSGLSYVMPILTSLWASKFSIIEQPELHLHPKAQCELADVFIAAFNSKSSALIESHSEHILLRILKRVRENNNNVNLNISHTDINIYYFEPQTDNSTIVKKIRVDKFGELMDVWPGGFFSEREGELFYE